MALGVPTLQERQISRWVRYRQHVEKTLCITFFSPADAGGR